MWGCTAHGLSRANMAHVRQSRPDSGLGLQVKVLRPFQVFPSTGEHVGVNCTQASSSVCQLVWGEISQGVVNLIRPPY